MTEESGLVIVQRDEGALLAANVSYHLSVGVSHIAIVDNSSSDLLTLEILNRLAENSAITILRDKSEFCDQAKLANWGLAALLENKDIQWIFPCDADEFIWCGGDFPVFLSKCRAKRRFYCTLPWLNHIPEAQSTADNPLLYLADNLFYLPVPERSWQLSHHFRKAFCMRHRGIEIVVGGHFFRREVNLPFFAKSNNVPVDLLEDDGVIYHYEMRDCSIALLQKWENLSKRHMASGVQKEGQWSEKEEWMGQLRSRYENCHDQLFRDFARSKRTLWGTKIQPKQLRFRKEISEALHTSGSI